MSSFTYPAQTVVSANDFIQEFLLDPQLETGLEASTFRVSLTKREGECSEWNGAQADPYGSCTRGFLQDGTPFVRVKVPASVLRCLEAGTYLLTLWQCVDKIDHLRETLALLLTHLPGERLCKPQSDVQKAQYVTYSDYVALYETVRQLVTQNATLDAQCLQLDTRLETLEDTVSSCVAKAQEANEARKSLLEQLYSQMTIVETLHMQQQTFGTTLTKIQKTLTDHVTHAVTAYAQQENSYAEYVVDPQTISVLDQGSALSLSKVSEETGTVGYPYSVTLSGLYVWTLKLRVHVGAHTPCKIECLFSTTPKDQATLRWKTTIGDSETEYEQTLSWYGTLSCQKNAEGRFYIWIEASSKEASVVVRVVDGEASVRLLYGLENPFSALSHTSSASSNSADSDRASS